MFFLIADWPVDLRLFEIRPAAPQLAFAGDSLPVECLVSNENLHGVYWYRQGQRVLTNSSAHIRVEESRRDPTKVNLTLRWVDSLPLPYFSEHLYHAFNSLYKPLNETNLK